jgi:heme-degrading monooxygenase HmoA
MADLGCSAAELAAAEHNQAEAAAAETQEAAEVDAEGPPRMFRMLTVYQVPPGAGKKFTKAWKKLACKVGGWKGSRGLALYTVMGANTQFVSYAAWEPSRKPSKKDREEKMKVFHAFKEAVEDMGVSYRAKPIFAIERPTH